MWDGDPIKRIRAGDGVSILKGRRLSLHIMIQPDVATGLLADPLLRDQGLLSRILVAAPCSKAGTRTYQETAAADETAIRDYGGHILGLWPLERFLVLDGLNQGDALTPGEKVKVVTE